MGKEKGQNLTACQDCVGLEWYRVSSSGGEPIGNKPICRKTEREKETRFDPIAGKLYKQYPYPKEEMFESVHNVNYGDCSKFEMRKDS